MKTITLAALLGAASVAMAEMDPPMSWASALPLQSAVCDVIGIGSLVSQGETNAIINVSQYWLGTSQTNRLSIHTTDDEILPTGQTNFVFFLSRYGTFGNLEPIECRFSYIFDMDYHRSRYEPDSMYLLNGNRSWFPVTPENADMVNWCSNLVHVSQVSTNRQAFYELIRDGYRLNPESSRMHRDSKYTFMYFDYFNDTNFMKQVWSDTNLVGWARGEVKNAYFSETQTWLP
ncbi:MAG: hypothetical protein PHW08_09635 [Kiritimatiellae bacterium]|jgi:hypothetical protein|nr:hypothetical protein [Kiritimatiellia bacterium]